MQSHLARESHAALTIQRYHSGGHARNALAAQHAAAVTIQAAVRRRQLCITIQAAERSRTARSRSRAAVAGAVVIQSHWAALRARRAAQAPCDVLTISQTLCQPQCTRSCCVRTLASGQSQWSTFCLKQAAEFRRTDGIQPGDFDTVKVFSHGASGTVRVCLEGVTGV